LGGVTVSCASGPGATGCLQARLRRSPYALASMDVSGGELGDDEIVAVTPLQAVPETEAT
jgi:hypothetical protein